MEENITVDFVRNWIEKQHLTKGSFDRIMRDLIYNTGHNEIDNPYLRDWLIANPQDFQDLLPRELNSNQQIVLEWLKEAYKRTKWSSPFGTVYSTINTHELFVRTRLTKAQQYQVLAAFAEWGMKEVSE